MQEEIFWRDESTELGFIHRVYLKTSFKMNNSKELFLFDVEPKLLLSGADNIQYAVPTIEKEDIIKALNESAVLSLDIMEKLDEIIKEKGSQAGSSVSLTLQHNRNIVDICKRALHNIYDSGYTLEEKQW